MLNFDWLKWVPPPAAKAVFLALFVFSGLLVLMIPKASSMRGSRIRGGGTTSSSGPSACWPIIFTIYFIF